MKVACLGAGYFAQFHYDAWRRLPDADLVGACDHDLEKATATGAAAFTELDAMLTATHPDILDIITPPPSHAAAIAAGITAGVKAIICQKPIAVDLGEADDMLTACERNGVKLIIAFQRPHHATWLKARDLIRQGILGKITQIQLDDGGNLSPLLWPMRIS